MTDSEKYTRSEKMAEEYTERDNRIRSNNEAEQSKRDAKTAVVEAIYTHISIWVKQDVKKGMPIPAIHKMSFGDREPDSFNAIMYIADILIASHIFKTPELNERLEALQRIKSNAEAMRKEIAKFDVGMMASAMHAAGNLQPNLEGRIVASLGADVAAIMGLEVIAVGAIEQIAHLESEIAQRSRTPGRARNEAAYKVALEAAKLYVKVTGRKPTYSQNQNGVSGEYTPFLEDVFQAFGWERVNLKLPAQNAIETLKYTRFSSGLIPRLPSI